MKPTRTIKLGLGCLAGAFTVAAALAAMPAAARTSDPFITGIQPRMTPIGTTAPGAASHIALVASADAMSTLSAVDRLSIAADTVYSLGRDHGFAGQVLDTEKKSIITYWTGSPPDSIDTYRRYASTLGLTLEVRESAGITRDEARFAAERITGSERLVEAAGVTAVSLRSDGQGFTVSVAGDAPSLRIRTQIAKTAGVDASTIDYRTNEESIVPLASRTNDSAPWKGGIRTVHGSMACSTAFAVLSSSSGRLLSANHCGTGKAAKDGSGTTIAPASAVTGKANIDSMSIDPLASPATTPKIYVGAYNSSTTKTVKSWASNWKGDSVCAGGATTGSRCGKIVDDAVTYPGLSGAWYIKARATSGAMAGGGDSGGPVYATVSGGVQARGVILGGYTSTATGCGTKNPDVSTPCYRDIAYAPISVVLNSWNYALEVG